MLSKHRIGLARPSLSIGKYRCIVATDDFLNAFFNEFVDVSLRCALTEDLVVFALDHVLSICDFDAL